MSHSLNIIIYNIIKHNALEGGCKRLLKGGQYRLALHVLDASIPSYEQAKPRRNADLIPVTLIYRRGVGSR